ncbi:MAG: CRISPR-associated protein [Tannerellaceae bacterium]|jgi:hypothetical protein|nr:CRISPR-associated protein [Tannerellaceae bacterium]
MLINLSNHPSHLWSEKQWKAAMVYGEVVDIPFPDVDPEGDELYIHSLSFEYVMKILNIKKEEENVTVHIMGEMTLSYSLIHALSSENISCIASTTLRNVISFSNDVKETQFVFSRFRKYQ